MAGHVRIDWRGSFSPVMVLAYGSKKAFIEAFKPKLNVKCEDKDAYLSDVWDKCDEAINGFPSKKADLTAEKGENTPETPVISKKKTVEKTKIDPKNQKK